MQSPSPLTKPAKQSVNLLEDRDRLEAKSVVPSAISNVQSSRTDPQVGPVGITPFTRTKTDDVTKPSRRSAAVTKTTADDVTTGNTSTPDVNVAVVRESLDDLSWLDALAPAPVSTSAPIAVPVAIPVKHVAGEGPTVQSLQRVSTGNEVTSGNDITSTSHTAQKETVSTVTQPELLLNVLETLKNLNQEGLASMKEMVRARLDIECESRRATESRLRDELQQLRHECRSLHSANTKPCTDHSSEDSIHGIISHLTSVCTAECGQLTERLDQCLSTSLPPQSTTECPDSGEIHSVLRQCHSWLSSFSGRLGTLHQALSDVIETERSKCSDTLLENNVKVEELQEMLKQSVEKNQAVASQLSECCSCRDTALSRVKVLEKELADITCRMKTREAEFESEKERLLGQTQNLQSNIKKCREQLLAEQGSWLQLVRRERAAVIAETVRVTTRSKLAGLHRDGVLTRPLTALHDHSHNPTVAEVRGMYTALLEEHQVLKQRSQTLDERQKQLEETISNNEEAKHRLATLKDNVAKQQHACSLKSREADELVKTASAIREEGERAVQQARQLQLKLTRQQLQMEHREAQLKLQQELITKERIQLAEVRSGCSGDVTALSHRKFSYDVEVHSREVRETDDEEHFLQQEGEFLAGLSKLSC